MEDTQPRTVIKVQSVSKAFILPHEKQTTIKSVVLNFRKRRNYELQQALTDVSVEVKKGEFFGIVGRNGSGKSTLLKLLAGIYSPTKGAVHVSGKLTPFIELGVGFNPELTGKENVFLNGALLGFNRGEMRAMYDDIVAFAELERFMDQKLKNYSSGMQVRLAFSIAIRAESDILVLDEVLAVGDANFQKKCLEVFDRYKAEKRTVILVTHDMENVRRYCDRALLLSDGQVLLDSTPARVAAEYNKLNQSQYDEYTQKQNESQAKQRASKRLKLTILNEHNQPAVAFNQRDTLRVKLNWPNDMKVKNLGIAIIQESGSLLFGTNTLKRKLDLSRIHQAYCDIDIRLGPGKYHFMYGAFGDTKYDVIEFVDHGPAFNIKDLSDPDSSEGLVFLDSSWHVKDAA